MAAQMHCHLRKCIQGSLEPTTARVESKAFEAPVEERATMAVCWREDGEAMFHDICWKAIIDSYKMDNPYALGPREKEMVKEAWKTAEYFDSEERVKREAIRIAQMLKTAKYAIAFTGAGISTSAGIGDFRGKAGKWTERDRARTQERMAGAGKQNKKSPDTDSNNDITWESLRPTYTHEVLCKLLELGHLKHIISQNTDGLHRLSGIPRDKISELHGNSFHERCEKCIARYERPYACRRDTSSNVPAKICQHCHTSHCTGRTCERKDCGGYLMNTIINFGDGLEHHVLSTAEEQAQKNDLVLCLGSSLRVKPACDLVESGHKPVRLVICNRQPTPFDQLCYQVIDKDKGSHGSRVFADCDQLMREVIKAILPPDELREFNEAAESRDEQYAKQRRAP